MVLKVEVTEEKERENRGKKTKQKVEYLVNIIKDDLK